VLPVPKVGKISLTFRTGVGVHRDADEFFVFTPRKLVTIGFFLLWALGLVVIYSVIRPSLPGEGWRKGLSFGIMIWLMTCFFFEIFTPFNMFGEPIGLMLYEMLMWLPGILVIGILIAILSRPVQTT
jgi:hypothetical protein